MNYYGYLVAWCCSALLLPFVGLVVPNIVSRLMGDNLRRSLGGMCHKQASLSS